MLTRDSYSSRSHSTTLATLQPSPSRTSQCCTPTTPSLRIVHSFTGILVARFLLDLQHAKRAAVNPDISEVVQLSSRSDGDTLIFDRVIGSLGSSLVFGERDELASELVVSAETDLGHDPEAHTEVVHGMAG